MFGLFRKNKKQKEKESVQVKATQSKEETSKSMKKVEQVEEVKVAEDTSNKAARKMPYHITKHSDGGWQIKRGKGKKALKRFATQKEAIDYAKVLEKEKGESYIIHKANGTTRKKTY